MSDSAPTRLHGPFHYDDLEEAPDLAMKRALYERLGVPAYWIVDPNGPSLLALRLTEGVYHVEAEVSAGEEFVTDWPFPLRFRPRDLVL